MKRISLALAALWSPFLVHAGPPGEELAWVLQSRQLALALGSQMKGELARAIAEGGPVAAIDVCNTRAPQVAAQLSQDSGARVGRTALRVRNPSNAPDEFERTVLEQFVTDLAEGPVDRSLEAVFEIRRGDAVERRYMRAIATDALCLTCHGGTLAPELAAAIAQRYPDDQATGFEQGQLRGAFSVTWPAVPLAPTP